MAPETSGVSAAIYMEKKGLVGIDAECWRQTMGRLHVACGVLGCTAYESPRSGDRVIRVSAICHCQTGIVMALKGCTDWQKYASE